MICFALLFFCVQSAHSQEQTSPEEFTTALTGKYPPFSYYNAKGELTGFDVDISREIAGRIGQPSRIVVTEWDGILAGLLAQKYDAIIGSMAITDQRREKVNFSEPYYHSGAQLFVHRDNPNKVYAIEECDNLRIAVVLGETYQYYLERNYPEIEVVTFKSTIEIFEMLEQKRISGFVTDKLVGLWQLKSTNRPFVPVGTMLYKEQIAIPVRRQDETLLAKINEALCEMHSDGTIKNIHDRYFGSAESKKISAMKTSVIAAKLLKGFGITLIIAASAIIIGFVLAVPCGVLLTHKKGLLLLPHLLVRTIVDFLRGTPVLIQLLFVWMGLGLRPFPAAILTLGINAMAYMAEVIRAGLISVDTGQSLAGQALGLSGLQRFSYIVWPQAFRIAIPPLMNSVVALIKDTALIAIISIPEIIRETQSVISVTFEPRKYYFLAALMFFVVTIPLMKLSGWLERRIKRKGYAND